MLCHVLKLRHQGVLIGHPITREIPGVEKHLIKGWVEMSRGKHLSIRNMNSGPGMGELAALYAPHLVRAEHYWWQFRGYEKALVEKQEAGVLQEWIVWPLNS